MERAVTVCDVGPRDGLQNEPETLPPAMRAELVGRLAAAGLPRVEAVSFVRDDRVPQMAGAEEVVSALERRPGTEYSGLVLNERGWERFRASGLDRVNCTLGATETFNRRNGNASLEEAVARVEAILVLADVPATVTISVAFGCPFEGRVDPGAVAELATRFAAAEVVLADTIGVATPSQVRALVERTRGSSDASVSSSGTIGGATGIPSGSSRTRLRSAGRSGGSSGAMATRPKARSPAATTRSVSSASRA